MPLNLGLVGAGGAGGAVDALQEIIKRRFLEQQEANRVANESRQRDIAQQLADQQGTYQSGLLEHDRTSDRFTQTKFDTEQSSKAGRLVKLHAYANDPNNPQNLRIIAEAQANELEGIDSTSDLYGPAGRALTQDDILRENYAKSLGYHDASQMTHEDDNNFLNWKTNATTRPTFIQTTGGFMQGSPGQGQGVTPVTPAPTPPRAPGAPPPPAAVQPIVPQAFLQGETGIVAGNRRTGDVAPAINKATGRQEGLPPALSVGPEGGVTVNKVTGSTKPLTKEGGEILGKAASPGTAARIAVYDNAIDTLRDLIAMKDDSWIGPVDSMETQLRLTTGAGLQDARAAFAAKNAELTNTIVQAVTGKQLSEAEGARIMKAVPSLDNPSVTWNQRAAAALEQITRTRTDELKLSGVSTGRDLEKSITTAELQAIANDTSTTLEFQKARYKALGYTIR